ncbi:hypothetical protein [Planctomycetes bacterium CA13]|uniref:hypothetical protein n=1 Tax=Novipirellula herctigrandis TaxID=2527986 RepID=UPI0011B3ECA0
MRLWQLDHAGVPKGLQSVIANAELSDIPVESYSDQPMQMIVKEGRPVIYSVGSDGKDDQAKLECDGNQFESSGDIVFRLNRRR